MPANGAMTRSPLLEAPAGIHTVSPSPDGRHLSLATFGTPDPHFLADTASGAVRPIAIRAIQLVGWLGPDRLAVRTRRELVILDAALQVRNTVRGFRAENSIVGDSRVLAVEGRALLVLDRGARSTRRTGTVPRGTWLIEPLR
jgi:hypothetical protein